MTDNTVTTIESGPRKVTRRVTVDAPAAKIFALVADPHRHPELDGSGTVRDVPVSGPDVLSKGARFSVGMKQFGVPYKITSTVTEFVDGTLIEWQHPLGHRWRWELEESPPGTTTVTETFDYADAKSPKMLEIFKQPQANAAGITKTLETLAARYA
jgi:uncharacterized protein YndB with AHSA1/START domain